MSFFCKGKSKFHIKLEKPTTNSNEPHLSQKGGRRDRAIILLARAFIVLKMLCIPVLDEEMVVGGKIKRWGKSPQGFGQNRDFPASLSGAVNIQRLNLFGFRDSFTICIWHAS